MKFIRDLEELPTSFQAGALTIGNFDGMHRGHAVLIQHIVEAEGGSLNNVVKITSFVTEITANAGSATHDVRVKYFGKNLPASTRVQVAGLVEPHLKIEIEAIAVLPEQ